MTTFWSNDIAMTTPHDNLNPLRNKGNDIDDNLLDLWECGVRVCMYVLNFDVIGCHHVTNPQNSKMTSKMTTYLVTNGRLSSGSPEPHRPIRRLSGRVIPACMPALPGRRGNQHPPGVGSIDQHAVTNAHVSKRQMGRAATASAFGRQRNASVNAHRGLRRLSDVTMSEVVKVVNAQ